MTKILTFFYSDLSKHEAIITRAAISLKLKFGNNVQIAVVTDHESYVTTLCAPFDSNSLVSIIRPDVMQAYNLKNYTAVFASRSSKGFELAKSLGCSMLVLPGYMESKLDNDSMFFGRKFAFPDVRQMQQLLPAAIRERGVKGMIL